ncbi:class I SAM-dependent methyltransferase [Dysgonomonas sp. Marseille-P4361]|uniref:class I SAM-dependent methyltransferase n=1 Tax=Dysgonomonas sp. Marseille-P4361 TaxID=2161820 RepID=UPI000D5570C6|nr:class I SAM-dependent methyltransferase [Dysgonomonas sp. Marseille-P4361]
MNTNYTTQDRGSNKEYLQYLEAMDAIAIEKVASASVFFEPLKDNTIVDVGMASGTSTAILAKLFPEMQIIGIDINPKMIQIAQETYDYPNLSFRQDDGELLNTFTTNSVNGFFNCSAIHHITSYNGYNSNRALNTLQRQAELLKEKGVLVVRDFVKPEEKEIIIELSTINKGTAPSDADLFILFSKTARSLSPQAERGFPIQEIESRREDTRCFKAFYTDVTEFIRRKDYYSNWEMELQEEYGYFTQKEFEETFRELGLRIIISSPIYNQWIINNRYKKQFTIYDLDGKEIGFPPTNYLIAGEKVSSGKQIQLTRHLPIKENPFLQYTSYLHTKDNKIWDVVHRPNNVLDVVPYYRRTDGFTILAKHGYPRPLSSIKTDSAIIDGKLYSGYVPEGISIGYAEDLETVLERRFGIFKDSYSNITESLNYYTSPGGIDERVSSKLIELHRPIQVNKKLTDRFSGFKESGYTHEYDAAQLLNTAQTGALVEARLELNIYNLFFQENMPLPKWLGEKIKVKTETNLRSTSLIELLTIRTNDYVRCNKSANFLTTHRALFSEVGVDNSNTVLEYVYPSSLSPNTLVTLPIFLNDGQIYIGLEVRSLPVPQLHSNNSTIITVPAQRLPKTIQSIYDLEQHIANILIGDSKIEQYTKLGEKYFPSIGVTPEQVYPYVVCLSKADKSLKWVSLNELYQNINKLEDSHLLICLSRLIHMIGFTQR